jgi:hypothetical protein
MSLPSKDDINEFEDIFRTKLVQVESDHFLKDKQWILFWPRGENKITFLISSQGLSYLLKKGIYITEKYVIIGY